MNPVELRLTCRDEYEARKIADALLDAKLVACVELIPVTSRYHWQGKVEQADEVKLVMLSVADNYDKVEKLVKELHSYDTVVLKSMPIDRLNDDATNWLQQIVS